MKKLSLHNLFLDFQSSELSTDELEDIIMEAISHEYPDSSVEDIEYTDDGVIVTIDDGSLIEIDIDWQEIILV